jgi:hypothetical protein
LTKLEDNDVYEIKAACYKLLNKAMELGGVYGTTCAILKEEMFETRLLT